MSKVTIDYEKAKTLVPLAKSELNQLENVLTLVQKVNFPNDEFDWGSLSSDISDSIENFKNYNESFNDFLENYVNNVTSFIDTINEVKITEVKTRNNLL